MPDTRLRPLMFVGTASNVGKSVITAAFCRILRQDGYHPAPFKAQNMSLNSFVTPDGLEIGRAQAVQAEAAGIPSSSDMNPVLLKPTGDRHAQLVLHGKPAGSQSAYEYFMGMDRAELWEEVKNAYDRLARQYDPIVLEGAGSISELNLRQHDITNMRMALHAKADVYLIADIDRGGIFGSVYGTLALLPPEEKALVRGVIINKFRGDSRLFEQGKQQLAELTGMPVIGVIPFFKDIRIEEEDSVALEQRPFRHKPGAINIAVIKLPHLSNFTDFARLEKTNLLHVYYTDDPIELESAAMIVLPGSKNTIDDLLFLRRRGIHHALIRAETEGRAVIGICGGYQMMGLTIADPHGVEGEPRTVDGLGLLPVHTILEKEKRTVRLSFRFGKDTGPVAEGYEIHVGRTVPDGERQPITWPTEPDQLPDGYRRSGRCWGTYIHGILDNAEVLQSVLAELGYSSVALPWPEYAQYKEQQYDRLADHIRENVDMQYVYRSLKGLSNFIEC